MTAGSERSPWWLDWRFLSRTEFVESGWVSFKARSESIRRQGGQERSVITAAGFKVVLDLWTHWERSAMSQLQSADVRLKLCLNGCDVSLLLMQWCAVFSVSVFLPASVCSRRSESPEASLWAGEPLPHIWKCELRSERLVKQPQVSWTPRN